EPNTRSSSNDFLNHTGQGRILTDQHHRHVVQGSPPLSGSRSLIDWQSCGSFQTGEIAKDSSGSTSMSFASPDSTNTTSLVRGTLHSKRPLRSLPCGVRELGRVSVGFLLAHPDLSRAF